MKRADLTVFVVDFALSIHKTLFAAIITCHGTAIIQYHIDNDAIVAAMNI